MSDNLLIRKLFHLSFLFSRPMTLGVRLLAQNNDGEILLVKHTYVSGWYLPGGGVETGETSVQAARKELDEEAGYECLAAPGLCGVYFNKDASRRDHVLLYSCSNIRQLRDFKPNREISEIGFFSIDALPEGTTKATHRRIDEHLRGSDISEYW